MTEEQAQEWIADRFGGAAVDLMRRFIDLLREESRRQNLVSATTLDEIWVRHIVDSAQLISFALQHPGLWLDIGTGAGFPGLVIAGLTERQVIMVEPRRRRVEFLDRCCDVLDMGKRAQTVVAKVERVNVHAAVISARAVASLPNLFATAEHCSTWNTLWLFPKGRTAREEIASAEVAWHGRFHVERSTTSAESMIVVAKEVSRR